MHITCIMVTNSRPHFQRIIRNSMEGLIVTQRSTIKITSLQIEVKGHH
jgi:hypothetical protein